MTLASFDYFVNKVDQHINLKLHHIFFFQKLKFVYFMDVLEAEV